MTKLQKLFVSRTFWTLVVMVVYNILNVYGGYLSPAISSLINLILGALVSYFKINPSQNYNTPATQAMPMATPTPPTPPAA